MDRRVLITSGAAGIGLEIARAFAGRAKATNQSVEAVQRASMARQSLERPVSPQDIVAPAVFLASDAAKSISGQMLPIDNDMQAAS